MATTSPVLVESFFAKSLRTVRKLSMSEWIKIGLTLAGGALIAWNMVQRHEYKIVALEDAFATHLEKHEASIRDIQNGLNQLHFDLIRLSTRDEMSRPSATSH